MSGYMIEKEITNQVKLNMESCEICPRRCGANRSGGASGFCGVTDKIRIARAALHMWEEPCISGSEGSGAVFFSGCNIGCVFCQNHEISRGQWGKEISTDKLADIFLRLEDEGANNINLVTPSHYVLQIIRALDTAKNKGLGIPVVYNTGSYELPDTLKLLEGYVDIYLPDCKYYSDEMAVKYSNAPGYYERALSCILEMKRQIGEIVFDDRGIMQRGIIIRHLVLPMGKKDSCRILENLYAILGNDVYYSIMNQYTPVNGITNCNYPELSRKVTKREYEYVLDFAIELGIENAFIQEGETSKESFIPPFDLTGI